MARPVTARYAGIMRMSSQEIKRLTALWRQAAVSTHGLSIGGQSDKYRLLRNHIGFHELDYDELRTACVELVKLLLLPGANTVIDQDHLWLWAWYAELLLGPEGPLSSRIEPEIHQLARINVGAALVHANPPTRETFDQMREANRLLNDRAKDFMAHSHLALSYLSFPLLEAIARRACPSYVDLNGVVRQSFARAGNSSFYQVGKRCSNLGDVLRLLRDQVADRYLRSDLIELLDHVAGITGSNDGCSAIFIWRNSSLHGETTHQTIGGTIFTLALMISLDGAKGDYATLRAAAIERAKHGFPSPFRYFPLY
jgi:hypothetical protein